MITLEPDDKDLPKLADQSQNVPTVLYSLECGSGLPLPQFRRTEFCYQQFQPQSHNP